MPLPTPRCLRCKGPLPGHLVHFEVVRRVGRHRKHVVGHWCRLCWENVVSENALSDLASEQLPGEDRLPAAVAAGWKAERASVALD